MVSKDSRIIRVVVSGGFDPYPHTGHIAHFRFAKALGDHLIVIVNSDEFLLRKKQMIGNKLEDRLEMVRAIRYVDDVIVSIDTDQTVAATLRLLKPDVFAKGGDRVESTMPQEELIACKEIGCKIVFHVNGKVRHSTGWEWHGGKKEE